MDDQILEAFAAYCRVHKITFVLHRRGQSFQIEFSGERDEDIQELVEYLKGREHDSTIV